MPIQVEWMDIDKTIIRLFYEECWGWQDAVDAHALATRMMEQVNHPVAVILDMTDSNHLPPGSLAKVRELSYMRGQSQNDTGITVFLDADLLTKAVVEFVEQFDVDDLPELIALYANSIDDAVKMATDALDQYRTD